VPVARIAGLDEQFESELTLSGDCVARVGYRLDRSVNFTGMETIEQAE